VARHPKREIDEAVVYALQRGWRLRRSRRGHAWELLLCPLAERTGCQLSVLSTPKSARNHAAQIRRQVDRCPHREDR
jgi:hypothetical protein